LIEQTLAILKPDCIKRNFAGKVIDQLLKENFEIVNLKMVHLDRKSAGEFYAVHKSRPFYDELVSFMTEGRVIVLALQREDAVSELRRVIGATDPKEASPGTVRQLYAESKSRNIIHASDSKDNAKIELNFFFSTRELSLIDKYYPGV